MSHPVFTQADLFLLTFCLQGAVTAHRDSVVSSACPGVPARGASGRERMTRRWVVNLAGRITATSAGGMDSAALEISG